MGWREHARPVSRGSETCRNTGSCLHLRRFVRKFVDYRGADAGKSASTTGFRAGYRDKQKE